MATSFWYPVLVVVTCTMVSACASDSPSDRQRPAYSYEGNDIGPNPSGRHYRVDEPPPRTDPYNSGYGR
jgi:hypothetical protein